MTLDANKLSAAKLWLISAPSGASDASAPRGLPYLAHALYALIALESRVVPRITCDEFWRISINPTWFDAASVPDVGRELAHVVWHLLSDHSNRARSLSVDRSTAKDWGTASDIAVSHTLDADRARPDILPTAAGRRHPAGRSAEEYFARLSGLPAATEGGSSRQLAPTDGCGSGADGISRAHELGANVDVGAVSQLEARAIRERVAIEYRDHATQRGIEPGDALRWVREVLEPETPWEHVLRSAVRRGVAWAAGRGDYTYSRRSRRSGSVRDVVLPGQHRPVPRISIVIDTSASVDDSLLARAVGEVEGVIRAMGVTGSRVTMYSVDAAVHSTANVKRARDAKLVGAGGTDMRVGLSAIADERPRPDVAIVFTDGDTPWPENPPHGTVVIVGLLGRRNHALPPTPEWVVRVECRLDG